MDTATDILVSIIVPTYNRGFIIKDTLASVQKQSYQHWECIIVDDFSEDDTKEIVETVAKTDQRFKYALNQNKKGAPGSRNTGFDLSKGDFIIFLDSDDLLSSDCLVKRLSFAEKKDADFYCFATGAFKEKPFDTNIVWNYLHKPENDLLRFLQQDMPWCVYGVLWTRAFLQKIGPWDESLLCWQDWDMHLRALLNKDVQYHKAEDEATSVDSFYRLNHSHTSIASFDVNPKHLQNRMIMLQKNMKAISGSNINGSDLEAARLVFRTSRQAFGSLDKIFIRNFFYYSLKQLGFSRLFIFQWYGYLRTICNDQPSRSLRKVFSFAPRLYRQQNLLLQHTTHLTAVFNS